MEIQRSSVDKALYLTTIKMGDTSRIIKLIFFFFLPETRLFQIMIALVV